MNVLFEDVIQSINFDQHEILKNIITLHCPDGFEVDPTFRTGGFYKAGLRIPRYCFDIDSPDPRCEKADCRDLPLAPGSVRSLIFDPPFLHAGGGTGGRMTKEYDGFKTTQDRTDMYIASLQEFWRVLEPQGILVFKCQDSTHGRRNQFVHVDVYNWAVAAGFVAVDLFIKLNKTAMIPLNFTKQQTARKMHSYFWVFRKPGRR